MSVILMTTLFYKEKFDAAWSLLWFKGLILFPTFDLTLVDQEVNVYTSKGNLWKNWYSNSVFLEL